MHGQTTLDASQRYVDSLEKINVEARKANLKLGIEIVYPLLSDYMKSSQDAMLVIDALGDADNLGVVIDSGHLNLSGEDPESAINNLGNRLLHVHVNDNNGKQQSNDVPGEGTFDFIQFLTLLKKCKYTGYVMAELGWHYSFDPTPAARKSLSIMKEYLNQIA